MFGSSSTGSLFGGTNNTNSAFGANNANPPSTPAGSLFGSTGTGASSTTPSNTFGSGTTTFGGSNSFGAGASTTGGNGGNSLGFGNTSTSFGTPAGTTQSAFGGANNAQSNPTQTNAASNSFGAGASNTTQNSFGAPAGNTTQNSFGSTNGATPSLFGSSTGGTNTSTSTLFGGGSGSFFGGASSSLGNAGSSFGNAAKTTPGAFGGSFGASSNTPAAGTSGFGGTSSFGNTSTTAAPGATSTTGSFGTFGGLGKSMFGSPATNTTASPGTFGAAKLGTTTSSWGTAQAQPQAQPQPQPPSEPTIIDKLNQINQFWDSNSPECKLQTYFYSDVVSPEKTGYNCIKPDYFDRAEWDRAVRENPDPAKYFPTVALGYEMVQGRVNLQNQLSRAHQDKLGELQDTLTQLNNKHSSQTSIRLAKLQKNHQLLSERLLKLASRVPATYDASQVQIKLDNLQTDVKDLSITATDLAIHLSHRRNTPAKHDQHIAYNINDPASFQKIVDILSQQQNGLEHLKQLLTAAGNDVDIVRAGFGLPKQYTN